MTRSWICLALFALTLAACTVDTGEWSDERTGDDALTIQHTFDFATTAPSRLSIMFTMAWFGIEDNVGDPSKEPQTPPGMDPDYHNWKAGGTPCAMDTPDPTKSDTCIRMGAGNVCTDHEPHGVTQRHVSSRRRPLTGIWSGTGRDTESQRKLDLMLSMLRRPGCRAADGAKLDAWTMQNNSIKYSSKYLSNPGGAADYPYRTMMALYAQADAAGIANSVIPGFDSTWYFNFSTSVGLGKCDDSSGNPRLNCINALKEDIRDLAIESKKHVSSVTAGGKPVLFIYTDSYQPHAPTAAEWRDTILPYARNNAGTDFYVVGVDSSSLFFEAFDALAPWLGTSSYVNAPGTSIRTDSKNHAIKRHENLIAAVAGYPGRLVFGGVSAGFDDWTRNWSGPCQERQMPTDSPRDPQFLSGQQDFFVGCKQGTGCITSPSNISKYDFRGFIGETWDDWTEGSEFEPDVYEGPDRLVRLRQLLGAIFGDAPDPAGDAALSNQWLSYGQARNGMGGAAGIPPVTDLACDGGGSHTALTYDTPPNDSTQAGRVRVVADADPNDAPDSIQIYVDDVLAASAQGAAIDVDVPTGGAPLAPGVHRISVKGWYGGSPGPLTEHYVTVTTDAVAGTFPAEGALLASTAHVVARDNVDGKTATAMQVYLDGGLAFVVKAPGRELLDTFLDLGAAGSHRVGVKSWYADGTNLLTEHQVTVSSANVVEVLPVDGSSVHAPVFVQGADVAANEPVAMQVYLDDALAGAASGTRALELHVDATPGPHRFVVKSWYPDGSNKLSAEAAVTVE